MPGVLALVLAAALTSLPPLPQRGLARETKAGVELQSLRGPPLATLRGLERPGVQPGVLARAPHAVGHWVWAERSPSGNAVLAQWSAECEVPVAYLIANGRLRAYGAETVALGWLPSGEAVVHFRPLGCVGSGRRGIYAVPRSGRPRLLLRTAPFAQYLMWGG